MPTETFQKFFAGKTFLVPAYQRDFAWSRSNIDDLLEDINEALETGSKHYIGAFILSAGLGNGRYRLVDGQQRLTALTMLLHALIKELSNQELRIVFSFLFLKDPTSGHRLHLLGENQKFFAALLDDHHPTPETESQKRLSESHLWIRERVAQLSAAAGEAGILAWLNCIKDLEVLEFIEPDEGKAIRMFQSVNDRGVPLSNMDKAKSLIIYYSNRFLRGRLDEFVNEKLALCFKDYSHIKSLAGEPGFKIKNIDRAAFTEDDILRHHYLAFDPAPYDREAGFDYTATSDFVLNNFLKPSLKRLRSQPDKLESFISAYVSDLGGFFSALRSLVEGTRTSEALFQLLVVLDLSAFLYPLTTRLQARGMLTDDLPASKCLTLTSLIEIADVRVYKLRGTTPARDILNLSRQASRLSTAEIANGLRNFVQDFMDDSLFQSLLERKDIYKNPGLYRILTEAERDTRVRLRLPGLGLADLQAMVAAGQSVEHILPQHPDSGFPSYGFENRAEYDQSNDRLGNLTLLTTAENSRCKNEPIERKITADNLYKSSTYLMTQQIAAEWASRTSSFCRLDIESRSSELARRCVSFWPLWDPVVAV
jgi:hypothetical protein